MDRDAIADRIIEDHTFYATIGGALPIPIIDFVTVTAVQVDLIRALAKIYDVPFDPATGKGLVASITGASAARLGASALKGVPVVGAVPFGIAVAGLSGASTYALGHLFRGHFAAQGTLADLDADEALPVYRALLGRGRDAVRSLRRAPASSVEETAGILERLQKLRAVDAISADEFDRLKAEALATA